MTRNDWNGILVSSWILISSMDHKCSGAAMLFSRICWVLKWGSRIRSSRSEPRTSNRYFCARIAKKRSVLDKIQYRKKVGKIIFEIGPAGLFSLTNALHYSEQEKIGSIKVLFLLNSYLVLIVLLIGLLSNISAPSYQFIQVILLPLIRYFFILSIKIVLILLNHYSA